MTDDNKPEFPDGLRVYSPHEKAPDFVKGAIVIERAQLIEWMNKQPDDKIRLDIKESRGGKLYAALNTYKPSAKPKRSGPVGSDRFAASAPGEFVDDDIPF